jgi:hypothetical protein
MFTNLTSKTNRIMAGCVTNARQLLFRHPSFWAEDEPGLLPGQVMEDPRVIAGEKWVYNQLSEQTTPFIASLDENTINVGFCLENTAQKNCFRRIVAHPSGQTSGKPPFAAFCPVIAVAAKGIQYPPGALYSLF